ncbi:MAG: hypothetical protein K2H12_05005 [Acetatifactor sp.]|nr:hypothetical protein [Acetatifactor sp.]MDE5950923.1 hypothetical protein [Acetatifactor sp.]
MKEKEKEKFSWKKFIKTTIYRTIFWGLFVYIMLAEDIYPETFRRMSDPVALFSRITALVGMFMVVLQKIHDYNFFKYLYKELLPLQAILDEIERRRYEKGKGPYFKVALYSLMLITCLTALVNEVAFWISFSLFIIVLVAKSIVFLYVRIKY